MSSVSVRWVIICYSICCLFHIIFESSSEVIFCSTKDKEVPENVDLFKLWLDGRIPYEISGDFNQTSQNVIEEAMMEYQNVTCIKFVPRSFENSYLFIAWDLKCQSTIEETDDDQKAVIYLSPTCLNRMGVLHQIAHVIGLKHEHNRYDRDNYAVVNWDNINEEDWNMFVKHSKSNDDHHSELPYDYNSVTHFDPNVASKNGYPTITAKQRQIDMKSKGLSSIDIHKVNKLYKCAWQLMGSRKTSSVKAASKPQVKESLTKRRSLNLHSRYKVNCDHSLQWISKRALENENNEINQASRVMQDYMKYWYGGQWSVIYHSLPLIDGWSITDHRGDNYCHIKIQDNDDFGVIVFEENSSIIRKHYINCDYSSQVFDRKFVNSSKNIRDTVEDMFSDFKQSFGQDSSFTIFCDESKFFTSHSTSDFCQHGLKNGIQCVWYQH